MDELMDEGEGTWKDKKEIGAWRRRALAALMFPVMF